METLRYAQRYNPSGTKRALSSIRGAQTSAFDFPLLPPVARGSNYRSQLIDHITGRVLDRKKKEKRRWLKLHRLLILRLTFRVYPSSNVSRYSAMSVAPIFLQFFSHRSRFSRETAQLWSRNNKKNVGSFARRSYRRVKSVSGRRMKRKGVATPRTLKRGGGGALCACVDPVLHSSVCTSFSLAFRSPVSLLHRRHYPFSSITKQFFASFTAKAWTGIGYP